MLPNSIIFPAYDLGWLVAAAAAPNMRVSQAHICSACALAWAKVSQKSLRTQIRGWERPTILPIACLSRSSAAVHGPCDSCNADGTGLIWKHIGYQVPLINEEDSSSSESALLYKLFLFGSLQLAARREESSLAWCAQAWIFFGQKSKDWGRSLVLTIFLLLSQTVPYGVPRKATQAGQEALVARKTTFVPPRYPCRTQRNATWRSPARTLSTTAQTPSSVQLGLPRLRHARLLYSSVHLFVQDARLVVHFFARVSFILLRDFYTLPHLLASRRGTPPCPAIYPQPITAT
ncbi:hypothetical protein F4818DRAFT_324064 [Hypoxylon cercidicola]|nr:hypothetical protein F4818DRAFT_324064 [Hypoxylon cercidicola]